MLVDWISMLARLAENCAKVGRRLERRLGSVSSGSVAGTVSETGKSAVGGPDGSKVDVTWSIWALSAEGLWRG